MEKRVGRPRVKLSNHLKKMREDKGISVKEAHQKLEVGLSMLYKYEAGTKKPSIETARKMTELYSCTLEDIFPPEKESKTNSKVG